MCAMNLLLVLYKDQNPVKDQMIESICGGFVNCEVLCGDDYIVGIAVD